MTMVRRQGGHMPRCNFRPLYGVLVTLGTGCVGTAEPTAPPPEVQADSDAGPALLPEAEQSEKVGTFTLRDGERSVEVRVFVRDSDQCGGYIWLNILTVNVYYRAASGEWKRAEPWSAAR